MPARSQVGYLQHLGMVLDNGTEVHQGNVLLSEWTAVYELPVTIVLVKHIENRRAVDDSLRRKRTSITTDRKGPFAAIWT